MIAAASWNKFLQTGWYDGYRVDEQGNVVIRRDAVTRLMEKFPEIDREKTGEAFRKTHAVRLGRAGSNAASRESRLVVDGGPLAHPCTFHEPNIGRMSLANSANIKTKNMCSAFTPHRFFSLCSLSLIQEKNMGESA
jgi:hypothetical protein